MNLFESCELLNKVEVPDLKRAMKTVDIRVYTHTHTYMHT